MFACTLRYDKNIIKLANNLFLKITICRNQKATVLVFFYKILSPRYNLLEENKTKNESDLSNVGEISDTSCGMTLKINARDVDIYGECFWFSGN